MTDEMVIKLVMAELKRARALHPHWPHDIVHCASIVSEEAGEVTKAVNDYEMHGKGGCGEILTETIQMIAMGIRFLVETKALYR